MATTQMVKVTVEELTKFGYKANGKFVNYSKQLSDKDKALVVPGASFEAEYYIADSGKEYLNKVLNGVATSTVKAIPQTVVKPTTKTPVINAETTLPFKKDEAMTRQDWDAKDRRISRQGCIQAAVQAVATYSAPDEIFDSAENLAHLMLEFVNK